MAHQIAVELPEMPPLPPQLTPFLGREQEVEAVHALLQRPEVRILTLTGPGGVGKTRLGLQVATILQENYAREVCFVPLAPVSDPALVFPTIVQALGLMESEAQTPFLLLKSLLKDRPLLLLLDNFEQIVEAAPQLAELVAACPQLKLLVTSRIVLRVSGEQEFAVPPLPLPRLSNLDVHTLSQYTAIALFLQRARASKPDFQMNDASARAIAEVCVRLDGLPLAIELAASRIKLLPPQALLVRLKQRLSVLTSGARDAPARQQTLRNTIAWSYQLLDTGEQRLFRRLSVFAGGCTLEAIESACSTPGIGELPVLDGVASLIDKNLLLQRTQDEEEPRLDMLETIREFGLECLSTSDEEEATRLAHAEYYLRLAEHIEPQLGGPEQTIWLDRLEQEHDNMRAALHWLLDTERPESREMALRLAGALRQFWAVRCHFREGLMFLERALLVSEGSATLARAKALKAAAGIAIILGDLERGEALAQESLALYRVHEDPRGIALCLHQLERVARMKGRREAARAMAEEALSLLRHLGDKEGIAWSIYRLAAQEGEPDRANVLFEESLALHRELGNKEGICNVGLRWAERLFDSLGDQTRTRLLLEESLALARELRDRGTTANCLYVLGQLHMRQGDAIAARPLLEESLALFKEVDDPNGITFLLSLLGRATAALGDSTTALALAEQGVARARAEGDTALIAFCIEALASVVASGGQPLWAARLWGAAEVQREAAGVPHSPGELADYQPPVAAARIQVGIDAFTAAWAAGRTMTIEQALTAPLEQVAPLLQTAGVTPSPSTYPDGLTAREVEVLCLVAQGLTDTQVAGQLVVSRRTVNWHLTSIYSKIGVSSRSAATRYAIERHLV